MNKSITIENRLILTHSQWTLHQMHETYWKVPMLSFWDHSLLPKKHNLLIQIPIQKEYIKSIIPDSHLCFLPNLGEADIWGQWLKAVPGWFFFAWKEWHGWGKERSRWPQSYPYWRIYKTKVYHQRLLYFLQHEGIRGITTPQCGRHSLRMVSMLACGLRSLSLCPSHNICFVQNTQSTLTVLFSTAEYKWLLANCWESLSKC